MKRLERIINEKSVFGSTSGVLAVILFLWIMAMPAAVAEAGMGPDPLFRTVLQGDFVIGGASTRVRSGPPQTDPFQVGISGIPAGSTVVSAFANWSYLTNSPGALSEADITINGMPVIGFLAGSGHDLCWGFESGASYTADVTSLVSLAGGNGSYTIGSAVDDATTGGIGEGFSLLVVYSNSALPLQEVDVYTGYTENVSSEVTGATANYGFGNPYIGGPAHLFINALDGQIASDDVYINGILASGVLPGTSGPGDAWQGALGPGGVGTNYYDHAEGNVSGFMNIDDMQLIVETPPNSDCVGHSFGAISFVIPEPATVCLLGLGGLSLLRRRRKGSSMF